MDVGVEAPGGAQDARQVGVVAPVVDATERAVGFTPGPWTVVEYHNESLVIHYSEDNRICFMATPGARDKFKTIEANANLIGAAPDLYAALNLAAKVFAMLVSPQVISGSSVEVAWAQVVGAELKARAALAKARGAP